MRDNKGLWILGGVAAVLAAAWGCFDINGAFQACVERGDCPVDTGTCDPNYQDVPDDSFSDANCDGIDGTEREAIFVDANRGEDDRLNVGGKMTPFRTLGAALTQAVQSGKSIYLAQGEYTEPSLQLDRPVSLYGGYSGVDGNWARGAQYTARITVPGIGLTVMDLGEDAGVTLDRLTVRATSVPEVAGAPCIGVRVMNSGGVRLRNLAVTAGPGNPGASASGTPAAADGGAGFPGETPARSGGAPGADGGLPGLSDCNPPGFGRGGSGGFALARSAPGQVGAPGVEGGAAGEYGCGTGSICDVGLAGGPGQNGPNGDAGTHGQEGDGVGFVTQGLWIASSGEQGKPGEAGAHGAGGGGGAEALSGEVWNGGGGGGGGGGGCGGQGGQGGQGGGASIALLIINGQVSVEHCALRTAGGGKGGAGAPGAEGGSGGPGGKGGIGAVASGGTAGNGGKGGDGGRGGQGGNGGSGGGGPSVGVWCQDSSVSATQDTAFTLGAGGASGALPPVQGNPGLREDYHQCPGLP